MLAKCMAGNLWSTTLVTYCMINVIIVAFANKTHTHVQFWYQIESCTISFDRLRSIKIDCSAKSKKNLEHIIDTYLNETPFFLHFCNILWFIGTTLPLKWINYRSISKFIRISFNCIRLQSEGFPNHDIFMQSLDFLCAK